MKIEKNLVQLLFLRGTLNNTTVSTLTNNLHIKEVEKRYIATYNNASSVTESSDKLWLLACSEIWDNGYSSQAYGYAITGANESTMYEENDEQTQYKYYVINLGSTGFTTLTNVIIKPLKLGDEFPWWLRSSHYNYYDNFCLVDNKGFCSNNGAGYFYGVSLGFCI